MDTEKMNEPTPWFDDYIENEDQEESEISEYELTATPNDFNIKTINDFIQSGAVKIPGFQRNYVWDIKRASKLIESLLLGLPIPQVFLYEEARNKFLVIDGQQRLMSIHYFIKQRFPKNEKRSELRRIFDEKGHIPDDVLHDDKYFSHFKLSLPEHLPNRPNKFKGLNYSTLGDHKVQFELRPIRNVIVKQNVPADDDSAVFEIFNRLNTGGVNLRPQEIRTSLYHSEFYDMLYRVNMQESWRKLLQMPEPDLHMKDVEILMRGLAILVDGANYSPSMTKFLNRFSKKCKTHLPDQNNYLEQLLISFLNACNVLPADIFISSRAKRFNIALYEAVFAGACQKIFSERKLVSNPLSAELITKLSLDTEFVEASQKGTTQTSNVQKRLQRASVIFG